MIVATPLGKFEMVSDGTALVRAAFVGEESLCQPAKDVLEQQAAEQIKEYFAGERTEFTLPQNPQGTPFQRRVWEQIAKIPYGETITYGVLATKIGNVHAARAVGAACGHNPLWIFLPCHRVLGKDGTLTGYAGGLERKKRLLELENGKKLKK